MIWTPTKIWTGQAAYLIGGGASLAKFDFRQLTDKRTIGCNDAYRLGKGIVDFVHFGDATWFHKTKWELEKFGGPIVCNAPSLQHLNAPWLHPMLRQKDGLGSGQHLAWNYSTGASAINLAISLGANPIYLLGYDLMATGGKTHWHNLRTTQAVCFDRFQKGFKSLSKAIDKVGGIEVFNVTNGESVLDTFPRKTFDEVFQREAVLA